MARLGEDHEAAVAVQIDEARRDDPVRGIDPPADVLGEWRVRRGAPASGRPRRRPCRREVGHPCRPRPCHQRSRGRRCRSCPDHNGSRLPVEACARDRRRRVAGPMQAERPGWAAERACDARIGERSPVKGPSPPDSGAWSPTRASGARPREAPPSVRRYAHPVHGMGLRMGLSVRLVRPMRATSQLPDKPAIRAGA